MSRDGYEPDRDKIIQELAAFVDVPPDLAPHEFTMQDFVTGLGLRPNKARAEMKRLIETGVLVGGDRVRDARHDPRTGARVVAYWRVDTQKGANVGTGDGASEAEAL